MPVAAVEVESLPEVDRLPASPMPMDAPKPAARTPTPSRTGLDEDDDDEPQHRLSTTSAMDNNEDAMMNLFADDE
jgi:hypothetical protein